MLQYREGLIDYQRVLDSIRALTQKQDQYAQDRGEIAINTIVLYKAFGGGWELETTREEMLPEPMKQEMEQRSDWDGMLVSEEDGNE